MKYVNFSPGPIGAHPVQAFRGIVWRDEIVDIALLNRLDPRLRIIHAGGDPIIVEQSAAGADNRAIGYGAADCKRLESALEGLPDLGFADFRFEASKVSLLPPVQPSSFRDFYAFEGHVRSARRSRGLDMVPEWYDAPVFYFSNALGLYGPNQPVKRPPDTTMLDFELEIGIVIGRLGRDISVHDADEHIAGFTIVNDWSMRDLQRREMKVGLGPCKSKDFATSIGPWLVTPDEIEDRVVDRSRGKRYDLSMTASVNGRRYSRGNTQDIHWTFAELIAEASRNTCLRPGDLIGSGTVGTGCIVEFPEGTYPWLQPGDAVRLEIERLGVLENTVS